MGYRLNRAVALSELACGLDMTATGEGVIEQVSSLHDANACTLTFSNNVPESSQGLLIAPDLPTGACGLVSSTPRFSFVKALQWLDYNVGFQRPGKKPQLSDMVTVGNNTQIGRDVSIGVGTKIGHNVVIADGVKIGAHCVIKSNAIIGEDGFGMERDPDGNPHRFIHLGSVQIGNHVEIGSLATVCRGTLTDTVIDDFVKIDDHVHIAHNCIVQRGAIITASVTLSGGVKVGELAWIGPNASVLQKIVIGAGSFIGLGATVTRDVPSDTRVAGNPARTLPKRLE